MAMLACYRAPICCPGQPAPRTVAPGDAPKRTFNKFPFDGQEACLLVPLRLAGLAPLWPGTAAVPRSWSLAINASVRARAASSPRLTQASLCLWFSSYFHPPHRFACPCPFPCPCPRPLFLAFPLPPLAYAPTSPFLLTCLASLAFACLAFHFHCYPVLLWLAICFVIPFLSTWFLL